MGKSFLLLRNRKRAGINSKSSDFHTFKNMFRKRPFQKSLSVFILLALLFNFGGYMVFFYVHLHQIRREAIVKIQNGLEIEDLVKISFGKEELDHVNWVEDHEFRFEGRMYDVIFSEKNGNKTNFYCYDDSKETFLFSALDRVLKNLKNTRKNNLFKLIKVYPQSEHPAFQTTTEFVVSQEIIPDFYKNLFKSLPGTVQIPPPKFS
ncbi:MAG: hypothetical protein CME35_04895 [Gramella sp.]|nr:hypothetical protein [Christiangramia sp.]